MPIYNCPNCGEAIVVDFGVTDFVHDCDSGNTALDEEDIVKIGDWEDYTGEDLIAKNKVFFQGAHGELPSSEIEDLTKRGNRKSTHRSRQHEEYINLKNGGLS